MKSVHRLLKLRHHKHTGKLLHHRHTSYRVLFLLMLAPVIMFAMVGQVVSAEDYDVTAVVPAPIPSGVPVITSPQDGATITTTDLTVRGTCPIATPAIVIAIYEGSSLLGSHECQTDKSFAVPVSLSIGSHTLVAAVKTITGQDGTRSLPVTITVKRAPTSAAPPSPSSPLIVRAANTYITFGPHTDAVWQGNVLGGVTPYNVVVNWGDSNLETFKVTDDTIQSFSHHYNQMHSYDVKLIATDTEGTSAQYHTAAVTSYFIKTIVVPSSAVAQTASFALSSIGLPVAQVYIATLVPLTGLWLFEHRRLWFQAIRASVFVFHRK